MGWIFWSQRPPTGSPLLRACLIGVDLYKKIPHQAAARQGVWQNPLNA